MTTNEEIWEKLKSERGTIDTSDCGTLEGEEGIVECDDDYTCPKHRQQVEDDIANAFRAEGYKQGQTDTAKQIFKELDEAVWEQIEPSRLEEFYEQFSNAKDLKASLNVATAFSIIGLDAEKYEALKKKHDIEE